MESITIEAMQIAKTEMLRSVKRQRDLECLANLKIESDKK